MIIIALVLLVACGIALLGCNTEGLGFILNPGGSSTTPEVPGAGQLGNYYLNLARGFERGIPGILSTEAAYKPEAISTSLAGVNQTTPNWLNLLGVNTNAATDLISGANTKARTAAVGDVGALGPGAAAAVRSVNPTGANLVDQLAATASDQLAAGTQLDPQTARRIQTSVRGDWARRGLGTSSPAELDEAVQEAVAGQDVLAQRQGAAERAAAAEQGMITNPALALSTMESNAPQFGQGLLAQEAGFANQAGPTLFPANQSYDIFNTAYNAMAGAEIARANNQAALDAY